MPQTTRLDWSWIRNPAAFAVLVALPLGLITATSAQSTGAPAIFKVKVLPEVRVRMRDGIELAVHITRPDVEGKFPAVMAYNAYRKLPTFLAAPSEREYDNGLHGPHYLAERGYICVNFDVRGTGASGGSIQEIYSDRERQDGYDMVEWIAAQPWSDGNVGMWGFSYGGVVAWQVAAMAPPHLKAIIVGSGTDDVYGDWTYPGGMPRPFTFGNFAALMAASNLAPPDADSTGDKWAGIWEEHLKNNVPPSIADLEHQTEDKYWQARSLRPDYGRIKCAVFVLSGWADWYPTPLLRAFSHLKVPKRALIGPWGHYWPENASPGPRIDGRPEYLQWFDQFLKGIDTGVLREPPVSVFVNRYQAPQTDYQEQQGFWRHENAWPPLSTQNTPMYLGSQGRLEREIPTNDINKEPESDSYAYRASVGAMSGILALTPSLDQREDEAYSLTYTTPPLEAELEMTGNPTADLFVSSSSEVAYFHVRICDVAPDGISKLVSDGGLNATHRTSRRQPQALKPGEIYQLKFDLKSLAYIFPAGHRIRIAISSADFQNAWPVSKPATNKVYHGARFPSRVILPVTPPQAPRLPTPEFSPSPSGPRKPAVKPEYTLTRDLDRQTTTLSAVNALTRSTFTVSDRNPAEAVLKSEAEYIITRPEGEYKVQAHAVTASDEKVFRHLVEVEVTLDGKRHFNKSWTRSVPRVLN